jgi:leucyl-tRNA synthetase
VEILEPVRRLFSQGMVLKDGAKMSKSKGNVVGAIDMAEKYGCDTARMYTLFAAPPEKDLEWNEQGIEGCARFLHRVFRLIDRHAVALQGISSANSQSGRGAKTAKVTAISEKEKVLLRKAHQTLHRVTSDFEARWHFNTSVALIMELVNKLHDNEPLDKHVRPEILKQVLELLVVMLSPIAPHLAEELWEMLGHKEGLYCEQWPQYSEELAKEEQVEVVIQINGRVRGKICVDAGLPEEELAERAFADPKIEQLLRGARVLKRVVIPNKLVNVVVAQ